MNADFDWLDPWYAVDDAQVREVLERQLKLECSRDHVLFGGNCRLIARRDGSDDALFALADGRVAEVHLTWRKSAEPDARWPVTAVFTSLDQWAEESMRPLHQEHQELGSGRS